MHRTRLAGLIIWLSLLAAAVACSLTGGAAEPPPTVTAAASAVPVPVDEGDPETLPTTAPAPVPSPTATAAPTLAPTAVMPSTAAPFDMADWVEYRQPVLIFRYPASWLSEEFPEGVVIASNEAVLAEGPAAAAGGAFIGFLPGRRADYPAGDLVATARAVAAELDIDPEQEPIDIRPELVIQGQPAVRLTYELTEIVDQPFVGFVYVVANGDAVVAVIGGTSPALLLEFEQLIDQIVHTLIVLDSPAGSD